MTNAIATQAVTVYRDYAVDNVPSSGKQNPRKSDIRSLWLSLGAALDGLSGSSGGGFYIFTTLSALNGSLAYPANTGAEVLADPTSSNNGIYQKVGASGSGSWTKVSSLTWADVSARLTALESDVSTLTSNLALYAPLASPAFTGTPTVPDRSALDNSSAAANTRYVDAAVAVEAARAIAAAATESARVNAALAAAIAAEVVRADRALDLAIAVEKGRAVDSETALANSLAVLSKSWFATYSLPSASSLPTTEPGGSGAYWNNGGFVCVTPGGALPTTEPGSAAALWANGGFVCLTPGGDNPMARVAPSLPGYYWFNGNDGAFICVS